MATTVIYLLSAQSLAKDSRHLSEVFHYESNVAYSLNMHRQILRRVVGFAGAGSIRGCLRAGAPTTALRQERPRS
jgi:hypothetical protein